VVLPVGAGAEAEAVGAVVGVPVPGDAGAAVPEAVVLGDAVGVVEPVEAEGLGLVAAPVEADGVGLVWVPVGAGQPVSIARDRDPATLATIDLRENAIAVLSSFLGVWDDCFTGKPTVPSVLECRGGS